MTKVLTVLAGLSALAFIGVSAAMNSLFLATLGRNAIEAGLFVCLSVAADVAKGVLPIVVARSIAMKAWSHGAIAAVLLAAVTALSLASGFGFAAMTRSDVSADRQAEANALGARRAELAGLTRRRSALDGVREAAVVKSEIAARTTDRRWQVTEACSKATVAASRQFCADHARLVTELASAKEREALSSRAKILQAEIEMLERAGSDAVVDPQSAALAGLLGMGEDGMRRTMAFGIAAVLELGSLGLILIALGPALAGWREPVIATKPVNESSPLPAQRDRDFWLRQKERPLALSGAGT